MAAKEWDAPTLEMARSFTAVRVLTTVELDIGSAINLGLSSARSEVVAFIDDDADAPPDWVEKLAALFADPAVGAAGGRDQLYSTESSSPLPARRLAGSPGTGECSATITVAPAAGAMSRS